MNERTASVEVGRLFSIMTPMSYAMNTPQPRPFLARVTQRAAQAVSILAAGSALLPSTEAKPLSIAMQRNPILAQPKPEDFAELAVPPAEVRFGVPKSKHAALEGSAVLS